jgi:type VI secretion system protein VasD
MERPVTRDDLAMIQSSGLDPMRRRALVAGAVTLLGLTATGCGTPKGGDLNSSLQAAADLNPSVNQRPSPLLIRVYELKSAAAFNQADFMSLYQSDQATLGADLLARDEFTLQPGESRPYSRTMAPETRAIGVFAAYRNLEKARWRVVVPVQPGKSVKLLIRADALAISAQAS